MPRNTDRFIQAVRLALQKRDIEKGRAPPPAQRLGTQNHLTCNSRPASQQVPKPGPSNKRHLQASPSTHTILNSPVRRTPSKGRDTRGTFAVHDDAAMIRVNAGSVGVVRKKRRLVSMFDGEDDIIPEQVPHCSRPKSYKSTPAFHKQADVVVLDDDSDEECIDLTGSQPELVLQQPRATGVAGGSSARSSSPGAESKHGTKPVHTRKERCGVAGSGAVESSLYESIKSKKGWGNVLEQPASQGRKKKEKEKRNAKYRSAPSKAALDRLERSRGHRLFLVDTSSPDGKIQFAVMGSNGNIYNCVIDLEPHCNCPDFKKRKGTGQQGPCKHLIFIFMRVLKLDGEDPRWWQKCLVQSELDGLVKIAQQTQNPGEGVFADDAVRTEYQKTLSCRTENVRRPLQGECTICYENLLQSDGNKRPENVITFCKTCGNNFHSACLEHWFRAQSKRTCPLCRSNMGVKGAKEGGVDQEYLNLAQHSRAHEQELTLEQRYADTHMYIGMHRWRRERNTSRGGGA